MVSKTCFESVCGGFQCVEPGRMCVSKSDVRVR